MLDDVVPDFDFDNETWAYNLFMAGFSIFLKNFEISLTSLGNLARIGGGIADTKVGLTTYLPLFDRVWMFLAWRENLDLTLFLKVVLLLSVYKVSQWESYTAEMNS